MHWLIFGVLMVLVVFNLGVLAVLWRKVLKDSEVGGNYQSGVKAASDTSTSDNESGT